MVTAAFALRGFCTAAERTAAIVTVVGFKNEFFVIEFIFFGYSLERGEVDVDVDEKVEEGRGDEDEGRLDGGMA